jgi:hypothetical protein
VGFTQAVAGRARSQWTSGLHIPSGDRKLKECAPGIGVRGFIFNVAGRARRLHCSGPDLFIGSVATAFGMGDAPGIRWLGINGWLAGRADGRAAQLGFMLILATVLGIGMNQAPRVVGGHCSRLRRT